MKKTLALILTVLTVVCMFVMPSSAKDATVPGTTKAPTIDGNLDASEWKGALKISLEAKDMVLTAMGVADPGPSFHKGSYMYMTYTKDALYIGAYVTDTTNETGGFGSDEFFIIFYNLSDKRQTAVGSPDNILLIVNPGESSVTEGSKLKGEIPGAKCVSKRNADGYTVEMMVPANFFSSTFKSTFGYDPFNLTQGSKFKMHILIHDIIQGGGLAAYTDTAYAIPAQTAVYTLGSGAGTGTTTTPVTTAPNPDTSKAPDTTKTPDTTKVPGTTKVPDTTKVPGTSETPASSETPSTSDETPGSSTNAPDTSKAPESTKAPDTTKDTGTESEDKSNVGMIIGIVAAVVVIAAVVIVIVVKKKKS